MSTRLQVALAQFYDDRADPCEIISRASADGADIVVFPEMLSNGYAPFDPADPESERAWRAGAVGREGTFVTRFREAARRDRIHVVTTFLESGDPDPFNAAMLIGPDGETILHHRKVHICDFDCPEKALARGHEFEVAEINTRGSQVRIGLLICMDREYADGPLQLSRAGAELLLVPNSCSLHNDAEVGDVRIAQARGRAFETVTAIAVANYPAPKNDGHSFAVGPAGEIIAMAGEAPELVHAEFDITAIRRMREQERFRWQR